MIQSYTTLSRQVKKFNDNRSDSKTCVCQMIQATTFFICFKFRIKGMNLFLYLGKGKGIEGIWQGDSLPSTELRLQDKFLALLRKDIRGSFVQDLEIDEKDRILHLSLISKSKKMHYSFFWKGREFFFVKKSYHHKRNKFEFFSPGGIGQSFYIEFDKKVILNELDSLGRKKIEIKGINQDLIPLDLLLKKEEVYREGQTKKKTNSYKKRLKKKIKNIENDYLIKELLPEIENYLKFQSKLIGVRELKIGKYKICFQVDENQYARADKLYGLRKKIKNALKLIERRLSSTKNELAKKENNLETSEVFYVNKNNGPIWKNTKITKAVKDEHNTLIKKIRHVSGYTILFGTNAQGNDQIRKENKEKLNLWFHVDQRGSAHLIINETSIGRLEENVLSFIGSILKDNGSLVSDEIDLVYAPVKSIKALKGTPGMVIVNKAKYLRVRYNKDWKDEIAKS